MGRAAGTRQQREYPEFRTLDELQQLITEEWERMDQLIIDNAVKQWRASVSVLVFLQTADILNICCKIPMLNSFGNKW